MGKFPILLFLAALAARSHCGPVSAGSLTVFLQNLTLPTPVSRDVQNVSDISKITYRLCVQHTYLPLCKDMATTRGQENRIACVSAPDKMGCIDRIMKGDADWMAVDPEELYVAHRYLPNNGLVVMNDIRLADYQERDHRYGPMAVIRKSSGINSFADLRGKRSCHTSYGGNAGWKAPFSLLFTNGQLQCTKENLTAVESDLKTVQDYFGPACLPGPWTSDKKTDAALKSKYPQLCQLCKNPEICDKKQDAHGGYEGALKCLTDTETHADVAWSKWDVIKDFFLLNETTPLHITDEYEILCRDGSKMALTSQNPCSLMKRPWRTFVMTSRLANNATVVQELQDEITALRELAQASSEVPLWLTKVLEYYKETDVEYNFQPSRVPTLTPYAYLQPKHYLETLWHPGCGIHQKPLRICVTSQMEVERCDALKLAAVGQRITPGFGCVWGYSAINCGKLVASGDADIMVTDAVTAEKLLNSKRLPNRLVSILRETEPTCGHGPVKEVAERYALAVIRAEIGDEFEYGLKGLKYRVRCQARDKSLAGLNAPMTILRDAGEITGENCSLSSALGKYFNEATYPDGRPRTEDALDCLLDGTAEVAFVDHVQLLEKLKESRNNAAKVKLLCKDGTVIDLKDFRGNCTWGSISPQKILVRAGEQDNVLRENARLSLLRAQELFKPGASNERILKLFGDYYGVDNLIFQRSSLGLVNEVSNAELNEEDKLFKDFRSCSPQGRTGHHSV